MTELRLRLDKWLEGEEIQEGAIAHIYPIAESGITRRSGHRDIAIPAGAGSTFRTVTPDPGRYLIEAQLPSGEILSEEVDVPLAGPPVEVRLRGDQSPHEWLSWQHFAGKVEETGRYEESRRRRASGGTITLSPDEAASPYPFDRPVAESTSLGRPPIFPDDDRGWQWDALADSLKEPPGDPAWLGQRSPLQATDYDETFQSFVLNAAQLQAPCQVPAQGAPDVPGGRHIITVRFGQEMELISLPFPWLTADGGKECAIDVLIRNIVDDRNAFRSSVTVRDPMLGSAISFMTAGGLSSAAFFFGQAKEMLFYKLQNPLAAAAGAYVLVSTQEGPDRQTWHSWVKNLMDWFPWLPDGAIQYGRLKLRDEDSESDIEEARHVLFTAYRRGLPFFSAGVRWLLSGLTIFAEEGDSEAQKMAKAVHRVSLRTDMSQPFTVVRFGPRSS